MGKVGLGLENIKLKTLNKNCKPPHFTSCILCEFKFTRAQSRRRGCKVGSSLQKMKYWYITQPKFWKNHISS
jgi:hypothetical protein